MAAGLKSKSGYAPVLSAEADSFSRVHSHHPALIRPGTWLSFDHLVVRPLVQLASVTRR